MTYLILYWFNKYLPSTFYVSGAELDIRENKDEYSEVPVHKKLKGQFWHNPEGLGNPDDTCWKTLAPQPLALGWAAVQGFCSLNACTSSFPRLSRSIYKKVSL